MGSHHVERHDEVLPAGKSLCVEAGDVEDGWGGVELALAYVDRMVGGLADVTDDVTDCIDEVLRPARSVELSDDVVDREDHEAVDDDARRCINDAYQLL